MSAAFWNGGDDPLVLTTVRDETSDVKTFVFAARSNRPFHFLPGQYVTIEVHLPTGPQWRCFTVASAPSSPDRVELTVKRQAPGGATHWLHEAARPGMALAARAISGPFHLAAVPDMPLALVSAGSGATPMMAMLRWLDASEFEGTIDYLHLARTQDDLLFRREVEGIAARRTGLSVHWLTSAADGRPDALALLSKVPSLGGAAVYCCGPAGFMDMVRAAHHEAGGRPEHFHEESFGAPPLGEMAALAPDLVAGHSIRLEPKGVTFTAPPGETILVSAAKAGIVIPSSCRQGLCATCRVTKLSGEAEMHQNGGLFDDEVEAGDILACCTYPRSPLTIRI